MPRNRKQLFGEIDSLSKSIASVSTWKGSKRPFGHIKSKTREDYVYEFWCYLKILEEINKQSGQNVKLVKGDGIFPLAPASKKDKQWSYYEIRDDLNSLLYIVCAGTGVKRPDASETVYHPDISFQSPNASITDDPVGTDVHMILDAKYVYFGRKATSKKISLNQISQFCHIVNVLLQAKKAVLFPINFGKFDDLKGNSLLSNAEVQEKHGNACKVDGVKQVGNFFIGKAYTISP